MGRVEAHDLACNGLVKRAAHTNPRSPLFTSVRAPGKRVVAIATRERQLRPTWHEPDADYLASQEHLAKHLSSCQEVCKEDQAAARIS